MIPTSTPFRSDTELIDLVRTGDIQAYAELYDRHHRGALAVAIGVAGRSRADDLVAEAFTRTLQLLLDGRGPDQVFRAYLYRTIRNTHLTSARKDSRLVMVEDFTAIEADHVAPDPLPGRVEDELVTRALASLPPRWQQVIRLSTIEERPLPEVAALMGISNGAAAQLAHRAREALRIAYLEQHARRPDQDDCTVVIPLIARHALGGSATRQHRVRNHLSGCSPCRSAATEIDAVASTLQPVGR